MPKGSQRCCARKGEKTGGREAGKKVRGLGSPINREGSGQCWHRRAGTEDVLKRKEGTMGSDLRVK